MAFNGQGLLRVAPAGGTVITIQSSANSCGSTAWNNAWSLSAKPSFLSAVNDVHWQSFSDGMESAVSKLKDDTYTMVCAVASIVIAFIGLAVVGSSTTLDDAQNAYYWVMGLLVLLVIIQLFVKLWITSCNEGVDNEIHALCRAFVTNTKCHAEYWADNVDCCRTRWQVLFRGVALGPATA